MAPTAAAMSPPMMIVKMTDIPALDESCADAKPPMPANVACANDTSPAMPVMTTIEQKMIE